MNGPEETGAQPAPAGPAAGAAPTVITVYPDGPLIVRGPFTLQSPDQQVIDPHRKVVALCRCGRSRIKPLCDGTHVHGGRAPAPPSDPAPTGADTNQVPPCV